MAYGGVAVFAAAQGGLMDLIPTSTLVLVIAYFFIGYFLYGAIFAAIGAAVTEMREAQALQMPVIGVAILLIYVAMFAAMQDTNSMISRVLSFVPPVTPFVMPMRLGNTAAPPAMWEVAGTLVIGVISVYAAVWAGAKIFRIGVLMYGKPPSVGTLVKWLRTV